MSAILPFGSWNSPLSAAAVTAATPRIEGARFVGEEIWWGEGVPEEGGRTTVRRRDAQGAVSVVLPLPWSARSRVHEYGGGAWTTTDDGVLLFVEKSDQRVWALAPGQEPRALTPADPGMRFGGLTWQQGQLLGIREVDEEETAPQRSIVRIALDGSGVTCLVAGSDFVAHPALSPSGLRLAWIAWNHPDMPWDRAELRVGRLADGVVSEWTTVAGGSSSPLQPLWIDEDDLLYADDTSGRWNLWHRHLSSSVGAQSIAPADADTGGPLWVLGSRWFARLEDGRLVAVRTNGDDELVLIGPDGTAAPFGVPLSSEVLIEDVRGTHVLVSGAGPTSPAGLWLLDADRLEDGVLIRGGSAPWGPEWMPRPRAVSFEGPRGAVHAFDYPPTHPDATGPDGEHPPYLLYVHGGPTSHRGGSASGRIAYFTSRGIGVLDVNYGGSSGYGRAYRERLRGQWGVVDVQDVAAAAAGLASAGAADPARITIAGGSAGGWTVLAALVQTDVFAAGISRYGVGDARALALDTHDFEARYLDGLIGPLPEAEHVYLERSPLSHPDRFRVPLLLLQGAEDPVVPPAQSEAIRDALAARGIPHAYVVYEGEGHGFRRAENVVNALETELAFLGAVFGFATPGVAPLELSRGA
ncbi:MULTISPECIES: prolyl oligopeptidase family serine peptidase [unclassified Microbacterium]|uniref:prolyl oligopeptidase family serine peptidase n=1 Tax=unclassified Microbacterium TaxID=2609290 RepID=UPI00214A8E7F|nr:MULTISPECIES: prolyl oligopeptidase family serine peptidase [unclassified Microbacterium]MCR2810005.1 prolyl oligopeptidase family serine peptidase [Microbacterium sp. zg.B185]WIM20154.1 prolyl oligopeptidase family serine peptidase [Microbacterium sp. zg-B185]